MRKVTSILYYLTFLFFVSSLNAQVQIGTDMLGQPFGDFGTSMAMSADGTIIATGSPSHDNPSSPNAGLIRVFRFNGTSWTQMGQTFTGLSSNVYLSGVMLSSNGMVLATVDKNFLTSYQYNGFSWVQTGQIATVNSPNIQSFSLSADGTTIALGLNYLTWGRTYVYQYNGSNWVQLGQEILGGGTTYTETVGGVSLSSDGSILAMGVPFINVGFTEGLVRVFEFDGIDWVQIGNDILAQSNGEELGRTVSLSSDGTIVAAGSGFADINGANSGVVKVNKFDGVNWVQLGQTFTGNAGDKLGYSISLSSDGNVLAFGAPEFNNNFGQAKLFQYDGFNWLQYSEDINGEFPEQLGTTVVLSSDKSTIAVGAPFYNDASGYEIGRIRAFGNKGVAGYLFLDLNQDCNLNLNEIGLSNRRAVIQPGNIIVETGGSGRWFTESLPIGNYTLSADTSDLWDASCLSSQSFSITNLDSLTIVPSIGLVAKFPCTSPDISIDMPFMRPCFTDQAIRVRACNNYQATGTLNNTFVVVTLDSLLLPTSFELPFSFLGNNQFQFDLGSLIPGECVDFWIKATVDCSVLLGQALCMEAEIFPTVPCVLDSIPNPFPPTVQPCLGEWDESSLQVEGYCQNDTIYFEMVNVGVGNMACYSPVTVYVDGVLVMLDSVQLNAQQVMVYSFPGNGESWHLSVDQHPHHPGNSNPNATVENCGGSTGQTKINLFAQDDADPIIDIYCGEVTGSYDPNDKTGYPIGVTQDKHIEANQQLQYRIRFQNTGTDTAFTVVIRDTLDMDLDIFSTRSGVASHSYDFQLYGPRVLEWTFNDIMLPDSNINEAGSHGFVSFIVDQLPGLPDGTQITNSAGIYFDFNTPIITNQSLHTIHYNLPVSTQFSALCHFVNPIVCNGDLGTLLSVNAYGGLPPYQYLWSNGHTLPTISGLSPGSYSVTITDSSGQNSTDQITFDEPSAITFTEDQANVATCNACNASAMITISGGVSPYSFLWSTNETNQNPSLLCPGNNQVSIVDALGCENVYTINISNSSSPTSSMDVIQACEAYTWIDGNTYTSSNNSETFTITNSVGCDSTITLDLTITNVETNVAVFGNTLTATAVNAGYQWLDCDGNFNEINGETNQSYTPTANGNFAVEVSQNNCVDTSSCNIITLTSLEDYVSKSTFTLYPNPNDGLFFVDLKGNHPHITITLLDFTGRLVSVKEYENESGIPVKIEVAAGIYFVEVSVDNGKKQVFKVAKY